MAYNKTSNNQQLTHEIVSLIFSDVRKSFLAAIAVAAILLMGLTQFIELTQGYVWLTVLVLTYMTRLVLASQYKKDSQQSDNAAVWLYRFRLSIALSGIAWGFAALVIFPTNNLQYQAFFALVLAGIAAGGLISFYIDEVSSVLFVSSIMLPMGYALMSDINPFAKDIFFLAVLFLVYVALASKRMASGLLSNIDLRVQAEKQQKEIHELLVRQKLHLEHTPMGVIEWDEYLNVVTWNKACSDIYGYSSEEAIGKHISYFMPKMHNKPNQHIIHLLLKEQKTQANFKEKTHKNGNIIYCEWFNTVLKDDAGAIVGLASLVQDKTEFVESQEKIRQLAYYDALTNLPNRGLMQERLNHAIAASERSKHYALVAFIDLDHFKAINDIKGHDAGDHLLKTISNRLKENIRAQDTVARIGGDEFLLILSNIGDTREQAQSYSESIINKISHIIKVPLEYDGYQHQSSASIGICVFSGNGINGDEIIRRADMSMYLAKKQGRNCYKFYDESMQPQYNYQMQLKQDLGLALAENQFQLYLQGQFDLDANAIGAEVLLRWQHPEFGMVMPNDFIPLAEETGLINPIGYWVTHEACKLLKKWELSAETKNLTISVNVSAIQFNRPDFINKVQDILKSTRCDPSKLCIELTESSVINSIEDLTQRMNALRAMGVSLAIDDFGIGYSSLSILKNLPLNELKIDKSFVQDITTNSGIESSIVQTILQMSKNLKLRVVAEGVETEQQLAYLCNYGCSVFQGYFFEKPCAVHAFEKNLAKKITAQKAILALPKTVLQKARNSNEIRH